MGVVLNEADESKAEELSDADLRCLNFSFATVDAADEVAIGAVMTDLLTEPRGIYDSAVDPWLSRAVYDMKSAFE